MEKHTVIIKEDVTLTEAVEAMKKGDLVFTRNGYQVNIQGIHNKLVWHMPSTAIEYDDSVKDGYTVKREFEGKKIVRGTKCPYERRGSDTAPIMQAGSPYCDKCAEHIYHTPNHKNGFVICSHPEEPKKKVMVQCWDAKTCPAKDCPHIILHHSAGNFCTRTCKEIVEPGYVDCPVVLNEGDDYRTFCGPDGDTWCIEEAAGMRNFMGFIWLRGDVPSENYYTIDYRGEVKYCKAVRFKKEN